MLIPRHMARGRAAALGAVVVAALALGGCDADGGDEAASKASGPGVVAPGRPGEPARTLSPAEAVKAAGDDTPNSADFRYARMMIEHHEQAVVMTSLVQERASSTSVKRLAERIAAGQRPEIGAMKGWLTNNGGDGRAEEPHDHSAMAGMATEAQLQELRASRGEEFDTLFLTLMITHHQGAITMATEALSNGNNVLIEEMADDVIAQQTVEIDRMRTLLA